MQVVERVALIVRPKRKCVEWVNRSADPDEAPIPLEEARAHATTYLVAINEDEEPDLQSLVEEHSSDLWELALGEWVDDEDLWPKNRTAHLFRDWFDVELVDLVWDLDEGLPLTAEAVGPEEFFDSCAWCERELD